MLRWSKWVKVGLNPCTVVLRWSKWVKVGVNPGKVVLRECKRVKGGLNPDTGVLRWSKRVKCPSIWFKCGSKLIHTDPEYPCKTKYLPAGHFVDAVQNNSRLIESREKMARFFVTK